MRNQIMISAGSFCIIPINTKYYSDGVAIIPIMGYIAKTTQRSYVGGGTAGTAFCIGIHGTQLPSPFACLKFFYNSYLSPVRLDSV